MRRTRRQAHRGIDKPAVAIFIIWTVSLPNFLFFFLRVQFRLESDEFLTSVEGHYSEFNGFVVVRSLKFISNLREYGPYGKEDGVPFALPAGPGGKIIGFHARSGQFLDAIGTYVQMD
jgi:hypothetical protein